MTRSPRALRPSGLPKGVRQVRSRRADGSTTTYWYCRLTNTRLPDPADPADPGADPAFLAAIEAARRPRPPLYRDGTLGALLAAWRASPAYAALAARTRRNRERYLRALDAAEWATKPVASLRRGELLRMRDAIARAHGPAAANMFAQSASALFSWGLDYELVEFNPLAKVRALDGGHFLTWTQAEAAIAMTQFHEAERRAVVLAYYTGLRRGDLVNLAWTADDGTHLTVMPEKTRRVRLRKGLGPLRIVVHAALRAELEAWRAENLARAVPAVTILTTPTGQAWTREYLTHRITAEVRRLGLRDGLNLHGFRKLGAVTMLAGRATTKEVAAAFGWESLAQVELYSREADQAQLGEAAILRLANPLAKSGKR